MVIFIEFICVFIELRSDSDFQRNPQTIFKININEGSKTIFDENLNSILLKFNSIDFLSDLSLRLYFTF